MTVEDEQQQENNQINKAKRSEGRKKILNDKK